MAFKFSIFALSVFLLSTARALPLNTADAQTCIDLCSSCNGVASFVDDRCECNIPDNTDEGAECVSRMRREAEERGLDLVSCNLNSDQRTTRCTLGSKHRFGKNDIDQVAKYFMKDGPMTGSIFQAPRYTPLGKSSDCLGGSRLITQPLETMQSASGDTLGSSQQAMQPAPQYVLTLTPQQIPQQVLSNPAPQQIVSNPVPQQIVSSPVPQQIVSNPTPQQFISSPNSDCVGASQVITQPKETMASPKAVKDPAPQVSKAAPKNSNSGNIAPPQISSPQQSTNDCGENVGQAASGTDTPIVGDVNPANLVGGPNFTPTLMQILSQHLGQPMLGIPKAIQTVTQSPGISDLVSAPGHLLQSLMQRLSGQAASNMNQLADTAAQNVRVGVPKIDFSNPTDSNASPDVGAQNPAVGIPTFSYMNPGLGSPFVGLMNPSLMNPTVGAPAPHVSYIQSMPLSAIPMIHNPMMGGFVPHVPTTSYIVGTPLGMPLFHNFNTGVPSMAAFNPSPNMESSFSRTDEQNVGQANPNEPKAAEVPVLQLKQKKICKKSTYEEVPKKITRDVKAVSESTAEESKIEEVEQQIKEKIESEEKHIQQSTTEVPKIDRTTTRKPITEKPAGNKIKVERSTKVEKEHISKVKPVKEIIKKPKGEKKSIEQKLDVKS